MDDNKFNSAKAMEWGKIILIGYGLYKIFDIVGGITDWAKEPKQDKGTSQSNEHVDLSGLHPTYSENELKLLSDQIQQAVWGGPFAATEDDETIASALMLMNNDDDVTALIRAYGVRGATSAWSERLNLAQTVEEFLDASDKENVNSNYASKGMASRWL